MSDAALLADHLDQRTEAILAHWWSAVERVGDISEAGRLSYAEFVDHVPELLDRLADRLRGRPSDPAVEAKKHGQIRWRQGYDIAEVVTEFGHLRTVLTRATVEFARQNRWDLPLLENALEAINDVLDQASAESVRKFQEDSQAETRKALAEVKARQSAIEDAWITAKLEKSKLRTVLASLPAAVWVVDADGTLVGINDEAVRLLGLASKEDLGPLNVHHLGPELQFQRLDGTLAPLEDLPILRALRGETVTHAEMIWKIRGEATTVMVNAAPLADASGAIVGAVAVIQDITARKRAEEQLRHERDLSRTITDTLGEGLCTIDTEGNVVLANPEALRMFGSEAHDLVGQPLHQSSRHAHPDGTPCSPEACPIVGVLRTGQTAIGDAIFARKDGRRFVAAYTASPIVCDGRTAGVVVAFRDITERKRLEARLAASEAQFRTIAEKSPVMIWRADVDGRCDYVNQTWIDFRGARPGPGEEQGWAAGIHPDDRPACLDRFGEAFGRREPFELTFRLRRLDGQYRWISDRGTPYHDAQGNFLGYLGSRLDITERIDLETALEQQRALAEEASRHKTRLVSALSHDARTPLNAVVLAAQLLEIHFDGGADPEVQTCLRTIRHSVKNVLDLVGDLLNLSKIDAGVLPPEVSRFPLEPVLAECLASVEHQARLKGLEVRLEPGPLAEVSLETDRSKLKQILSNLLSNALRYTERGQIRIFGEQTPERIRIGVEDTGIGIAPSDQQRIFDEFAVLDHPQRAEGGTGLGLAICRRLANLLSGEIGLRSTPGVGSTFTLDLPISTLTLNLPATSGAEVFDPPGADRGAILVAEDHDDSRQTLARVLRRMGYHVLEASDGRAVLDLTEHHGVMAVLMDVNMPVLNGIEATLALRRDPRFRDLPIFALTGDVTLDNQQRIGEAGVNGYLEKPVTLEALRQALAPLRARRRD